MPLHRLNLFLSEGNELIKSASELKNALREKREHLPENLSLRLHRGVSWLMKAEDEQKDLDASFIFLWISFNALYGAEMEPEDRVSEKVKHADFFDQLLDIDLDNKIYSIIWEKFSDSIRLILNNQYIYQKFWDFHNGDETKFDWQETFEKKQRICQHALLNKQTPIILKTLFRRLYTLRNQLVHGGATWKSSVNRDQVNAGAKILNHLVPIFLEIMLQSPEVNWGKPNYPVIKD